MLEVLFLLFTVSEALCQNVFCRETVANLQVAHMLYSVPFQIVASIGQLNSFYYVCCFLAKSSESKI